MLEDTQETAGFHVTRTRQSYKIFGFLIIQTASGTVLDQVSPDIFLTSSKADDKFMDLCGDLSMDFFPRKCQVCTLVLTRIQ